MKKLFFKTKAQNLVDLQQCLQSASVLDSVVIYNQEFKEDFDGVLKKIRKLKTDKIIVRSSSFSEDSKMQSNAGAFLSIANVNVYDSDDIYNALESVGKSLPSLQDEILIQPMIQNILMCGVAFSVDKDNFAPYFCIQYDKSGLHNSVTDGSDSTSISYYCYRFATDFIKDQYMYRVVKLIMELEKLYDCNFLDIEFAFDCSGKLFCLQVRPLIMHGKINLFDSLEFKSLQRLQKRFLSMQTPRPNIHGDRAIFGVMPDWNPAEIIGFRPKRLALSLYKEIITDNIWAYQRDNYGYRNLRSYPLMQSFLGVPYIDIRLSFNSFIPKNLNDDISNKLVNFYIDKLCKNQELHDKIEFSIVYSCYDFNISKRLEELLDNGFNENEVKRIEFSLLELTNNIINPNNGLYLKDIQKSKHLQYIYDDIKESDFSLIDKIYLLLENCKRYGTLPFAGVARAGFIAMQMLNSLVSIGFFTENERNLFLNSLHTISKELSDQISILSNENKKDFLDVFGHLRAGTYDILSPRYDEDFDFYFDIDKPVCKKITKEFIMSDEKLEKLDILLQEHGVNVSSIQFLTFLKDAIEGREYVKFEFSKLLSLAILYIQKLGEYYNISKEDMAHIDVNVILNLYSSVYTDNPKDMFLNSINLNKQEYLATQAVKLPFLLFDSDQFFSFFTNYVKANFITQKSISGQVATDKDKDLEGKIILIYAADPGYDYLFTKNIAGFITCYGGANSHMAIRASELGMPAAIGVGEEEFKKYLNAKRINIECATEQIYCLS